MYCVNIFSKWYKTWEKNGWKTASNKEVLNQELIQKILGYIDKAKVNFIYVPAHTVKPTEETKLQDWIGNNKADELARKS